MWWTILQSAVLRSHIIHVSICPSLDVVGSWPHTLKILETNCVNYIFAFRSSKVIHLLPEEHGEILEQKLLALVSSFGTASAMPLCLRRWIVPLLLDHTDIASLLHNTTASHGHLRDSTAFLFFNVFTDRLLRWTSIAYTWIISFGICQQKNFWKRFPSAEVANNNNVGCFFTEDGVVWRDVNRLMYKVAKMVT